MLTTQRLKNTMKSLIKSPQLWLMVIVGGVALLASSPSFAGDDIFDDFLNGAFKDLFGDGKKFWRLLIGADVLACSFIYWKTKDLKIFSSVVVLSLAVPFFLRHFVFN